MKGRLKTLSDLLIVVIILLFIVCIFKINIINKEIETLKTDIEDNLRKNLEEYDTIYDSIDEYGELFESTFKD